MAVLGYQLPRKVAGATLRLEASIGIWTWIGQRSILKRGSAIALNWVQPMPTAGPTVKSLDERTDDLERSFTDFKDRVETMLQLAKWIAGFAATTLVTSTILALSAVWSAGSMSAKLDAHGKELDRMSATIDKQSAAIDKLAHEVTEVRLELSKIAAKQKP
jgi:methyl-accepting chemotaxis protein